MDSLEKSVLKNMNFNVCCCCLREGCSKNVSTEYYYNGQKEVYENMLKDTFDVQITHPMDHINMIRCICDDCILQLRTASNFKLLTLSSEQAFKDYMKTFYSETGVSEDTVKFPSEIKVEADLEEMELDHQDVDVEDANSDQEILANLKSEEGSSTDEAETISETSHRQRRVKLNKCRIEFKGEDDNVKEEKKDWTKLVERRGTGPILRENSLKLIANSTICIFQWNKSWYRCFCCNKAFPEISSLKEHNNTHTLQEIEKKIISQQNRLVKVDVTYITCKICSVHLESLADLRKHLQSHNISFILDEDLLVPFKINSELQCQLCSENFTAFRHLNMHMNKHFQKQVCHICGTGFSNLVFLNLHKTRAHKSYSCKECEITFSYKTEKRRHDTTVHGLKIERKLRFPCPYCQERFFQENLRVQHLVDKHGLVKPEHKCEVCSKVFITRSLRNNHVKNVHKKEKVNECDICHNFFYTKSDVLRHRVTHTGEKKFSCALCNSPFATKDSLRRHMKRTHVGIK